MCSTLTQALSNPIAHVVISVIDLLHSVIHSSSSLSHPFESFFTPVLERAIVKVSEREDERVRIKTGCLLFDMARHHVLSSTSVDTVLYLFQNFV